MIYHTGHLPDRKVKLTDGKEYLWFSGTDYLGMGHNVAFKKLLNEGLDLYGTHFGSSRNNSLRLDIYEETEKILAKTVGAQAALTVSSGFWAGQLVHKELTNIIAANTAQNLPTQHHYAPGAHPAIWGDQYIASKLTWAEWAEITIQFINQTPEKAHIICTDSIGSPWAEQFDLSIFEKLPDSGNIWLIVDDSHGMGVIGNSGFGTHDSLRTAQAHTIVVSSLNKAMGIQAGVIFSSTEVYNILRSSPWFAGASPPAPAYMYALKSLLESGAYANNLTTLRDNIAYFNTIFNTNMLFSSVSDYPVLCSRNTALFDFLLANDILVSCFSYPLPTDAPVSRIVLSSIHQKKDLDKLAEVCMRFQ